MHEVAEAPSCALSHFILAAAGFPEVSYWGQLCMDRLSIKPTVIQVDHGFLCILLTSKLKRQKQSVCHSTAVLLRADSLPHYCYTHSLRQNTKQRKLGWPILPRIDPRQPGVSFLFKSNPLRANTSLLPHSLTSEKETKYTG